MRYSAKIFTEGQKHDLFPTIFAIFGARPNTLRNHLIVSTPLLTSHRYPHHGTKVYER